MTKTTKNALVMSALSLVLCVAMLLGTTFAWFTDSVTSANNIIKTGNLDVSLEHSDTALDDADAAGWIDASTGAIFNYGNWEPGYSLVKYVKIENEGSLDLKFVLNIVPNEEAEEVNLADVIEVYMMSGAQTVDRDALTTDSDYFVGNLTSLMNEPDGAAHGVLYADDADKAGNVYEIYTLVLKMSDNAGNEYMDKTVGGGFAVQLLATQLASESDSIGPDYDADAEYPVVETVTVPANNTEDVVIGTENIKVTVPAAAATAGDVYKTVVSNETVKTNDATGETKVSFDLTMYKNEEKVSGDTVYAVTQNVGKDLLISAVTHNGVALTKADTGADQTYTYDSSTGDLTIYTKSFSPFEITYIGFAENFADNSWDNIILACQENAVPATWNVGDIKTMTIGGKEYKVAIIGKNHDTYSDGTGKAPLTFQLVEVCGTAAMNTTQTNTTGWSGSAMRNTTMAEILSAMPSAVQNAIKAVNKETLNGTRDGLETTSDKLFLMSEIEVNGSVFFSNNFAEGARYDYYANGGSSIMNATWWLRGPGKSNAIGFTQINMSGYMANGSAEYACGVVFGFCF